MALSMTAKGLLLRGVVKSSRSRTGRPRSGNRLQLAHVGNAQHGRARLVAGGQVDHRVDAPVMVARRVVEDLPDGPAVETLVDDQQRGTASIRPGKNLVVHLEVRLDRVGPRGSIPPATRIQRSERIVVTKRGQL